jgi:hypothetical protein
MRIAPLRENCTPMLLVVPRKVLSRCLMSIEPGQSCLMSVPAEHTTQASVPMIEYVKQQIRQRVLHML